MLGERGELLFVGEQSLERVPSLSRAPATRVPLGAAVCLTLQ